MNLGPHCGCKSSVSRVNVMSASPPIAEVWMLEFWGAANDPKPSLNKGRGIPVRSIPFRRSKVRKLVFVLLVAAANSVLASDAISEAKDVVTSHEQFAMANDLDGVMSNMADTIVVLAYAVPLIDGKSAFREFYAGLMASGRMVFEHDYTGEEAIGEDVVVLHGVSRGTLTTSDGTVSEFSNNFVHVLRRAENGKFKFWRATFAPDAAVPLAAE